jgi:hypothetical protein
MDWIKEFGNTALLIILIGVIWKMLNDKFDGKANANRELIDKKVDIAYYKPKHDSIEDNLRENRADHKEIKDALAVIHEELAIMNGAEIERAKIEKEWRNKQS